MGTRVVSEDGRSRASLLERELVARGVVVVSGLAVGVDSAAHMSSIANDGRTVGVIGTPLNKAYPAENAWLQEQIYREHLLISPFAIGQPEGRPVVLIDDGWTLGGHLKAACCKFSVLRQTVALACTVAHTTHEHVDKPVSVQEHKIDLSGFF